MKKTIVLVLILGSLTASAQNIDTVLIRTGFTMQAQDWAWLVGTYANQINADSATAANFRRIRTKIQALNPPAWTTNVGIDSIPGNIAMAFYRAAKSANAGEIANRYTAITTAINGKAAMVSFTSAYDAVMDADFNRKRDLGKIIVMNQ